MKHYVYQITNNINGKIYIGKRSCVCEVEDDAYMGSGRLIRIAIKKYGIDNFSKTIIDVCETAEQAYELEALIVDTDFLKRQDTYNLCGGGIGVGVGECAAMFGKNHTNEAKLKMSSSKLGKTGEACPNYGREMSDEHKAKISNAMKGRTHSPESRAKMSKNHVGTKGRKLSPESVLKMLETRKINKLNKGLVI